MPELRSCPGAIQPSAEPRPQEETRRTQVHMLRLFHKQGDGNRVPREWKEKYEVRVYESDNLERGGLITLFNYFQNSAWSHYSRVDKALGPFLTKNQIWAMTRVEIQLERPARWQEVIEVETWSRGIEKLMAFRDFVVRDARNRRIAGGTATWVVLDLESRKIQRLTELAEKWPSKPDVYSINKNAEKVDSPAKPECSEPFKVQYSDMDLNRHVNSARYVQWMLDSFGREFLESHEVRKAEINYIDEAMPGDEVFTGSERQSEMPLVFLTNVSRKSDNREVCRARLTFS